MSSLSVPLRIIHNQPCYVLETPRIRLAMTRIGGHVAPVEFLRQSGQPFQPYYIAPWAAEGCEPGTPTILQVLRGDFFCCPFGGNSDPFQGERHPVHGQTANEAWTLEAHEASPAGAWMRLCMDLTIRPGRVEKHVFLAAEEDAVYVSDVIRGMSGPMNFGHHATLQFPDSPGGGRLSFSPWRHAQVYVKPTEDPAQRGYSILKPGALIGDLTQAPRVDGLTADLTRYPARRGYEDIAIVCAEKGLPFAWTAAAFESLGAVWFALRDPAVLPSTLLWHSNGGRHYPPWSGRNVNCLGLEDILGYFHEGIAASAGDNDLAARGIPTSRQMDPAVPLAVNYIQGAAAIPKGFGAVASIEAAGSGAIRLTGENGATVEVPCRIGFLKEGKLNKD